MFEKKTKKNKTEGAIRPPTPYEMYWVGFRAFELPSFEMYFVRSSLHVFAPTGG